MTHRQFEGARSSLPSAGLAACVLGLLLCPFAYIAIGALRGFGIAFTLITAPPLLASSGYLLYRFLSRPVQDGASRPLFVWAEAVSWVIIAAFLVLVSGFTLMTGLERIGLTSALFLATTVISFPVVLIRRMALQERLMRLPSTAATLLLATVLVLAATAAAVYALRAPAFP